MRNGPMPKPKSEEIKKHGDTLEPLIERTGGPLEDDDEDFQDDDDVEDELDVDESE